MAMSSAAVSALEVAPTQPAKRPRRPSGGSARVDADRHGTASLVTDQGQLRMAPLIAAMSRELAPGAETQLRRHAGPDIVCMVIAGVLRYEPVAAPPVTLWAETIAVLSTGAGVDHRWRSIGDEPAQVVMLWLAGPADGKPRMDLRMASRLKRLGALAPIAGRATGLPTHGDVSVMAGVLPVGGALVHTARGRRSYVMSTIGAITVDGVDVAAGSGVLIERTGAIRIAAKHSTEVLVVETA